MSERSEWAVPGAIVIAGALVGLGAFFGTRGGGGNAVTEKTEFARVPHEALRAEPGPVPSQAGAQPEPTRVAAPSLPADAEGAGANPVSADSPVASNKEVQRRAKVALEAKRAAIVKDCWNPSAAKNPKPTSVKIGFSLAYKHNGEVIGSGVIENREALRSDMFQCLAKYAHTLAIAPPHANISVEIYTEFP